VLNRDGRRLLVPLFGSVTLLFFIACFNVAGLLLTRGLQRHPEYAMRSVLGAGRWRLFRQTLTESLVVATAGAALGGALATGIVTLLKAIAGQAVPRTDAVHIGWPVFAFGFFAAILAAGVAGLLPAARASHPDRFLSLNGARTTTSRHERRLLGAVSTLQIVLTVALLAGAALLVRTARNLDRMQPGYDTENILAMTVTTMERQKSAEFHRLALERVSSVPGVTRAAFAWGVPLTGNKWPGDVEFSGQARSSKLVDRVTVPLRSITEDYFEVMGMTIVEGRAFRDTDGPEAPRVAIVNATLAKRYYADRNPIGAHFQFAGGGDKPVEIVGVVADTRTEDLSQGAEAEVYLPFWQSGAFSKHLVVRASGDPAALANLVRRQLRAIDPTAAVERVTTMGEIRRESVAARTFAMRLLIGFAIVATVLAVVGLYGVLSLSVNSRIKEIAVRKAVGAQRHQIVQLVVAEGSKLIGAGLLLGAMLAVLIGRLLQTLLFDVRPADPVALAVAAVAFGLVAVTACFLPAFRASRVDLMQSLRQD
jgi:putative ABC transport system permease protein